MALDLKIRRNIMATPGGVKLANIELLKLFSIVEKLGIKTDSNTNKSKNIHVKSRTCRIEGKKHTVELVWDGKYKNTLEDSVLYLKLWQGHISNKGRPLGLLRKPKLINQRFFRFDLDASGACKWQEQGIDKIINSESLAKLAISTLEQAG